MSGDLYAYLLRIGHGWNNFPIVLTMIVIATPLARTTERPFMTSLSMLEDEDVQAEMMAAIAERRDRSAFAQVFEYFAPRIKAYMRRMGADSAQAEELMQEAMITLWRRAASYDPAKASLSTWLYTIARNKRIDAIRRAKRPDTVVDELRLHEPVVPSGEQLAAAAQTARIVRSALAELPEEQAAIVRMSYFEGQSHSMIAEALGLPLGTVKSRVRLALQKLRQSLGQVV